MCLLNSCVLFFISWVSPLSLPLPLLFSIPDSLQVTRKYLNPPQHVLVGYSLECHAGFARTAMTLKGAGVLGQASRQAGPLYPYLRGVCIPFWVGSHCCPSVCSGTGGGQDLNSPLLEVPGCLCPLVLYLRPSLVLQTLFHLEWVFKPLAFALKVSLLWSLVEISVIFLFIVKEWVGTKNISVLEFFLLRPWTETSKCFREAAPRPPHRRHCLSVSTRSRSPELSCQSTHKSPRPFF